MAGCEPLSTSQIVAAQHDLWYAVSLPVSFVIYLIAMVGETNRAPFDLPEAESELVGGFHTEYTSLKFAMFFLAEYINMVTVSALAVTLFLGGWAPPPGLSHVHWLATGWFPMVWFLIKVLCFIFLFVWLRGTLPRMRYDQFMKLGWKVLIPISLLWILAVAAIKTVTDNVDDRGQRALLIGVDEDGDRPGLAAHPPTPVADGGFPVPPLDLVVPPTPRSLTRPVVTVPAELPSATSISPEEDPS